MGVRGPKSSTPQPSRWTRVYIDIPTEANDELSVIAAKERLSKKSILESIIIEYIKGKTDGKAKK